MRLVMAYETQIYQSLVDEPILFPELTHLQGPRRLRFLFFRIRMSKSKEHETYHRGCGGDRNNAVQPELPGVNFGFDQKVLPLKGAEAVSAPDKDRINRKPLLVSTSFLKNLRSRPKIDHNYMRYICKNLHRTVGPMRLSGTVRRSLWEISAPPPTPAGVPPARRHDVHLEPAAWETMHQAVDTPYGDRHKSQTARRFGDRHCVRSICDPTDLPVSLGA